MNPQGLPGGSLFQAPLPGFDLSPSGVLIPSAGLDGAAPAVEGALGAPDRAPASALTSGGSGRRGSALIAVPEAPGYARTASGLLVPLPALEATPRIVEAAAALVGEDGARLSESDANSGAGRLQALLETAGSREPGSGIQVPAGGSVRRSAGAVPGTPNAVRAPPSATAVVPETPLPAVSAWRAAIARPVIWARSFKHYFVDVAVENWREYKERRKESLSRHGLAVDAAYSFFVDVEAFAVRGDEAREFIADTRLMGQPAGYRMMGASGSEQLVVEEARVLFGRYFKNPAMPERAKVEFEAFLSRASSYNRDRRSSNLRKHIRKALVAASVAKPEQVARHFQDLLGTQGVEVLRSYGVEKQAAVLAQFRADVAATVAEEALFGKDPAKRAIGVVLFGSFASGKASPMSDLDIHVLTADGSSDRVKAFLERLQARWKDAFHALSPAPFAFPPSRSLLLSVHVEPYRIYAADVRVERMLSPPAEAYATPRVAPQPSWRGKISRAAQRAFLLSAFRAADVRDAASSQFNAASTDAQIDDKTARKALIGLFAARTLSIAAFILTMVAYAMLGADVVGKAGYADLRSLSSVMSIVLGPLSGAMIGRMTLRNSMAMNATLRILVPLAIPALVWFGGLNFWTLFVVSMVMGWNLTTTMISEDRLLPEITKGRNLQGINALTNLNYLGLSVLLGIFLGWGKIVDFLIQSFGRMEGLSATFAISGVVHIAVLALYWWAIPNIRPSTAPAKDAKDAPDAKAEAEKGRSLFKTAAIWIALIGVGTGLFFVLHTTIPLVIGTIVGVSTTQGFKRLWKHPTLRAAVLYNMLVAFLFYPVNEIVIPFISRDLGQNAHFMAQLTGAMFFGQLVATSTRLTLPGRWNLAVQGAVLSLVGVWFYFYLFPGSLAALALGMAGALGMFALTSSLTDRGWIKFYGFGLAFVWLPYFLWGQTAWLFVSVLMIGMFFGPNKVTLESGIQGEAKEKEPAHSSSMLGVKSALTSAAIALGYGATGLISKISYPDALLPTGIAFAVAAVLFWLAPKWLGGRISEDLFRAPEWLRRLMAWGPAKGAWLPGFFVRRAVAGAAAGWLSLQPGAGRPTKEQALALLEARIQRNGVKVLIVDYDGTLMDKTAQNKSQPASEELLGLLARLRERTGVRIALSTNHFFTGDEKSLDSLLTARMSPESRAGLLAVVQGGSRIYEYGPAGEAPTDFAWRETPFDEAERALVTPVFEAAARTAGLAPEDVKLFHEDSRSLMEVRVNQERVGKLVEALEQANRDKGWNYLVQLKPFPTMREGQVPYVQIFKAHKGTGARRVFETLKERKLVESEEQVLILGDDFKEGGNDLYMSDALPGAVAVSLGDVTARRSNVLPWHADGAAGSLEILRSLIKILDGKARREGPGGGPSSK